MIGIDPESADLFTRPDYYELLADLRRDAPVHRYGPNSWALARYAEVREVSQDPGRFYSSRGVLMNDPARNGRPISGSVLHMDPPTHAPWRHAVSRQFTPRAINSMEDRIRSLCASVLDELASEESAVDFVATVSSPFPVLVIAELLGIGAADRSEFRRWSDATIEVSDDPTNLGTVVEFVGYLTDLVEERRRHPGPDLVSTLATATIDGEEISASDAVTYCMTLLVAGNETTRHLISGAVLALAEHPDQRAALAADPSLAPAAVEECLRWVTPIQSFGRTVAHDTSLAGEDLQPGDFVVMLYASANRDEAAFGPTAHLFDIRRRVDAAHVAFGFGEHFCLGAMLARMEARIMLTELLARFPSYALDGAPEWNRSTLIRGLTSLPVRLRDT